MSSPAYGVDGQHPGPASGASADPSSAGLAPIDPLAPAPGGVYSDALVEVRGLQGPRPRRTLGMIRTLHFDVTRVDGRLRVVHRVPPEEFHSGLAALVGEELFGPGWLRGAELLERIVTGIVVSSDPDPLTAWERYYRATLTGSHRGGVGGHHDLAPVHQHARELLTGGSVLELGSCFGFLALSLAAEGRRLTVSDIVPGTIRLLGAVAERLDLPLDTLVADAADVPLPAAAADTVLVLHLLEHLDEAHGARVLTEAVRLARRRVVVAVPLEDVPDETWGHLRTVSLADLRDLGQATGFGFDVHEHHGGWLVIDRAPMTLAWSEHPGPER
ncbi:MAG: mycofactocin oligosaccharide methyltransferase MftM [Nocardioides sp.]|uniref:mycofactocin oligosaccharide methyltransferase MftM n=1 Tax=Nocardioides sp. TaxID=35761 RepID=UPI0039E58B8D